MRAILRLSFIALTAAVSSQAFSNEKLINGRAVVDGSFAEVVWLRTGNSVCTATIIGPRVIITAAHCAETGAVSTFKLGGKTYSAKITRSSLYPSKDHDIALGLINQEIEGTNPASIGGKGQKNLQLTILGYGCTREGGGGGNDGVLRKATSTVTGFVKYDMISKRIGGGAVCYGDSGGPAFILRDNQHLLVGVNSKGDIKTTNYNTRTDIPETRKFLANFAAAKRVQICGINAICGSND